MVTLTGVVYGHVSPLNELQQQILSLLGLPITIYSDLIEESGGLASCFVS